MIYVHLRERISEPAPKPEPEPRDELGYPVDWPKCPGCDRPVLDGHATCGDQTCRDSSDLP